jgi:glutaredoxin
MTMYQAKKVRLFIKPYCGWCGQAMAWLDQQRIRYDVLDVIQDGKAYAEMFRLSGQTLAPVLEVDGQVLADFGAAELAKFWSRLSKVPASSAS